MAAVVAPLSKGSTPGVTAPERLDEAFAATPRAAFLPVEVRDRWREDRVIAAFGTAFARAARAGGHAALAEALDAGALGGAG